MGVLDVCIFKRGCVGAQKCELHPLSAMRIGLGGVQLVELDNVDVLAVAILICVLISFGLSIILGVGGVTCDLILLGTKRVATAKTFEDGGLFLVPGFGLTTRRTSVT